MEVVPTMDHGVRKMKQVLRFSINILQILLLLRKAGTLTVQSAVTTSGGSVARLAITLTIFAVFIEESHPSTPLIYLTFIVSFQLSVSIKF